MRSTWMLLLVAVAGAGLVVGGLVSNASGEKEKAKAEVKAKEKLTLDQVPEAVKAAIVKEAGTNEVTEIVKKVKDEKAVYEAEWKADGKEVELKVAEDGTVLVKEEEITLDQLPEAVKKTVLAEAGEAKIEEVEKKTKGGVTTYSAEWKVDGKEVEVVVAEDGKLLKKQVEEDKEESEQAPAPAAKEAGSSCCPH